MSNKKTNAFNIFLISIAVLTILLLLVRFLGDIYIDRPYYLRLINATIFFLNIVILSAWLFFGVVASVICLTIAFVFTLLTAAIAKSPIINMHLILFGFVMISAFYFDKKSNASMGLQQAELEDIEEELNLLNDEYLQNQLQLKALEKSFSRFSILKDITEKLSSSLSLAEVANLVVKSSFSIINKADCCLLYLIDEKKHNLVLTSIRKSQELKGFKIEGADIFDLRVLRKKQPLIIQDIRKDYRFNYEVLKGKTREFRSLISTPLISEDRAIGVIRLDAFNAEVFNSEDLRILNIIADLGAVAVENAHLYERTEELAVTDGLTGCYVQRYMKQLLTEEIKNTVEPKDKISFLMIDIDHFKKYNDNYGHIAGDIVLKTASRIFMKMAGARAIVARYGGEEFAIGLPGVSKKEATVLAEKIRKQVEERIFYLRREKTNVTISIGVASITERIKDVNGLIAEADKALYEAKESGRNKVCIL
jgi:diguanylate cyclase (GGDEF)-like protein